MESSNIKLYYQNTRGLRSKTVQFFHNVVSTDYNVICLTETWLKGGVLSGELFPGGYQVFRRDRGDAVSVKKDGGGVLVAVDSSLDASHHPELQSTAEDVWVSIKSGDKLVYIVCAYLPPSDKSSYHSFLNNFESNQQLISNNTVIVVGDFNLPHVGWVDSVDSPNLVPVNVGDESAEFIDLFSLFGFNQFSTTRNSKDRILDLIFCNENFIDRVSKSEDPLVPEDRHHPSLEFHYKYQRYQPLRGSLKFTKNFKRADYDCINRELSSLDWVELFDGLNVDDAVSIFYDRIGKLIDKHVPTFRVNTKYLSYFRKDTIKCIKQKLYYHKKYKKFRNQSDYINYSILRKSSKNLICRDYSTYLQSVESDILSSNNGKGFWRYMSNRRKSRMFIPKKMTLETSSANGPREVCELFATFFKSTFETPKDGTVFHFRKNPKISIAVDESEVRNLLQNIEINKSPGPTEYPQFS
ncbi:uncharacterized protein LOC123320969 [Coccinella septempunctata]|uniref:uncharacterized protein LOC123320967 n=1 Tax=Coccinella septempunctata TaxID=41139 RepID=UPI001D089BA2|nr:uncharacterized protein LOC123320967 [Coccinella septempunctata]XP_044764405.1 uncharacterized protein LOC123320969 [Coccinella septempunctata]